MDPSVSDINLGKNVQSIRKLNGMTIKKLAEEISISSSMLSQIERGLANPSIATIKAIADVLHEPLYNFFLPSAEESTSLITRADTRQHFSFSPSLTDKDLPIPQPASYVCERLSAKDHSSLEVLLVRIPPHSSTSPVPRQHEDIEVAYVENGTVSVQLGNATEVLGHRDSITILPNTPHRWINDSDETVFVLMSMTETKT